MSDNSKKIFFKEIFKNKSVIIGFCVLLVIIALAIGVGIHTEVSQHKEETGRQQAFDTSEYAEAAAEENDFQYSDSVVEINKMVFAVDSDSITVRKSGSNNEKTLVKGNLEPGIVTDSKVVYYFDLDAQAIMSVDVKTKDTKEIVKVADKVQPDALTSFDGYVFARFDGMYGDTLYYQMQEGENYMPNYAVNVKSGDVKKLALAEFGTYKLQIAGGKLYYDIFRTMNHPSVLYTAEPDGTDIRVIAEGVSSFEVIGDKIYYFKAEDVTKSVNKIMVYDIKNDTHTIVRDNMEYCYGAFTTYGMISDRLMGNALHTVIDYYDGTGEALGGSGVKVCGEVAIIHAGVPEDIASDTALEQARVPEWYVVGNGVTSELITLPENTVPANYKDGYLYYYTFTDDGKSNINRLLIEF